MEILIKSKKNYLTSILIGKKFFNKWKKNVYPSWEIYCKKNKLGLIIFRDDLISKKNLYWKKATWQKLLIGSRLLDSKLSVKNVCYLDADILINPNSPNIFNFHIEKKFSLVSCRLNIPYEYYSTVKKISYYRKKNYYKKYPLNSALLFTNEQTYKFHNLKVMPDEACMGLFIFNLKNHSKKMKDWFFKYKSNIKSFTGGGDQIHFNYEIQSNFEVNWINYKFQCIWNYEMANYYPFLYSKNYKTPKIIKECLLNSLFNNYFLHFAGSWYESNLLYESKLKRSDLFRYIKLNRYLNKKVVAKAKKRVLPQNT